MLRAFLRRLDVIRAYENLENEEKVPIPKEVMDGEEIEIVTISSAISYE
jgi:hypothetical protein